MEGKPQYILINCYLIENLLHIIENGNSTTNVCFGK